MSKGKWEVKKLGEIGTIFTGNSINAKTKKQKYSGLKEGVPYIATKDVGFDNVIDYNNGIKIPFKEKDNFKIVPSNTPIICIEGGSAGRKIAFTNQTISFGNKLLALVPNPTIHEKFIYYYYFSPAFQDNFINELTGIIGGVSLSKFKSIEIPFPILSVQQRIVSLLDEAFESIDQAKANAEKNLENAKELFESYRDSFFYSKEWEVKLLGDVCTHVEYGTSSKSDKQGEVPVLRMGNIQNGFIDWEDLVYTNNKDEINRYLLKYNDVLFNRTNSYELVGKTAIYKGESPAIFAGYLIRIHRNEKLLDADYLNYYLNSKKASEYGKTVVTSSVNQANINGTKLKSYPIPLPPIEVQQSIVSRLDNIRLETLQLESQYQTKLENLEELRKSILEKAFNGEL